MEYNDNDLINEIILKNDNKSSSILYNKYYKELKIYLRKKYKNINHDDIDDLASEAISKSFISIKNYDSNKSSFKTWIYTIADNLTLNFINKLENRVEKIHYNYLQDIDNNNFDIPSNENQEKKYSMLQELNFGTEKIDSDVYKMMQMKYIEGYSYEEIGNVYSMTSSTIFNKITYAKGKVIKKLKGS
jgi:RNA polymerase sigma-70 factor (ECF subfamily)